MEIQYHTQSPKAVWTVVGLERPWGNQKYFDWLPCKGLHCFTAETLLEKIPVLQHLSWRPTAGQRA